MTLMTSSAVTTRWTPGTALAAVVSIDLMRPWATVERNTLPCSIAGSRRLWVYSARQVTFSRASSRGGERPIWLPESPAAIVALAISVVLLCLRHRASLPRTPAAPRGARRPAAARACRVRSLAHQISFRPQRPLHRQPVPTRRHQLWRLPEPLPRLLGRSLSQSRH